MLVYWGEVRIYFWGNKNFYVEYRPTGQSKSICQKSQHCTVHLCDAEIELRYSSSLKSLAYHIRQVCCDPMEKALLG